jgi:PIN domain
MGRARLMGRARSAGDGGSRAPAGHRTSSIHSRARIRRSSWMPFASQGEHQSEAMRARSPPFDWPFLCSDCSPECSPRTRGRIGESTHVSAVATLEDLYAQLRTVAIDEALARHAGDLAARHALRGYDAVHLACALALEGDDALLATWDDALNAAARASGRLIANDTD